MSADSTDSVPDFANVNGLSLRPVSDADYPFLRALYREVRRDELSVTGAPQSTINAFCDSQFSLQDQHYRRHYPHALFYVIERATLPVGRIYVSNEPELLALMEVSILEAERNRGHGTALVHWLAAWADATQRLMRLYVEPNNPARHLYERHGFVAHEQEGVYLKMRRPCAQPPQTD